jgi:1,4-dihydroxy-2-naphthoate octaprenyltransferase
VISLVLFALAGILVGGVIQLVKADATKFSIGLVGVLAALATAGGFAWWPMGES